MSKYVIGVDVGGTNIKIGIVNPQGEIIVRTAFATAAFSATKMQLVQAIHDHIHVLIKQAKLTMAQMAGIGVGLPGLIDPIKGVVHFLPNISGWKNVLLAKQLSKLVGISVFIDNDVKVITLAEAAFGAGKNVKHFVCLTLGTGVGAGLILDGRLYRGLANAAGELGHMPLNEHGPACNCGGIGCFERYVGNKALVQRAVELTGKKDVTLQYMHQSAKAGNKVALKFWQEAATRMGNGLVGIVNLLNPELIVIGGGVSNNERFLFPTMRQVLSKRCMTLQGKMVKIKRAKFKDDAGIIGAYVLVMDAKQRA